jgi:hypothetical protein
LTSGFAAMAGSLIVISSRTAISVSQRDRIGRPPAAISRPSPPTGLVAPPACRAAKDGLVRLRRDAHNSRA